MQQTGYFGIFVKETVVASPHDWMAGGAEILKLDLLLIELAV
jgi:hypothetical protein